MTEQLTQLESNIWHVSKSRMHFSLYNSNRNTCFCPWRTHLCVQSQALFGCLVRKRIDVCCLAVELRQSHDSNICSFLSFPQPPLDSPAINVPQIIVDHTPRDKCLVVFSLDKAGFRERKSDSAVLILVYFCTYVFSIHTCVFLYIHTLSHSHSSSHYFCWLAINNWDTFYLWWYFHCEFDNDFCIQNTFTSAMQGLAHARQLCYLDGNFKFSLEIYDLWLAKLTLLLHLNRKELRRPGVFTGLLIPQFEVS